MKTANVRIWLMLFWWFFAGHVLAAQPFYAGAMSEKIQACTDRTLYVTGEKICFTVSVIFGEDSLSESPSRIFYAELITPAGNRIAGGKYPLDNSAGAGCLVIPEEAVSGVYFLKCYTRLMRNAGTDQYNYTRLKIVNPYKPDVLAGKTTTDSVANAGLAGKATMGDSAWRIRPGKQAYRPGENIRLEVTRNAADIPPAKVCLSVVPEGTFTEPVPVEITLRDTAVNSQYFPETRSVSLSGQLVGKETGKPVAAGRVYLSVIGDKDIQGVTSDSSGRFIFSLPEYTGARDIFLCASPQPGITPEILINNDFCSRPVRLPACIFSLDEQERLAALKLAVNTKVAGMFREEAPAADSGGQVHPSSFYGEPSEILAMDKYIDLPTLGEYFTELPLLVKVRKTDGRKQFRFWLSENEMLLYDPLVLVDWVAVDDIEKILSMSPLEIARIEFVNSLYVKGAITYGGIVSFVSRKNDFAGIDLPKSGTFVNYRFLEECTDSIPRSEVPAAKPDPRNTVFWNPDVQLNQEGQAEFSFPAPETPGRYLVLCRGIGKQGTILQARTIFDVLAP